MSEELQKPPVLDFDALLAPISEENPAGENLRYSGIYDEIAEARRSDDALVQGDWQTELKTADYRTVIQSATDALTNKAKDLQIAAWLSESLVMQHGFLGLRDGLILMTRLEEQFWDTLHPEIDEGDMEGRANAISWMDAQTAFAIKKVAITQGAGYSYIDWEDAKRFTLPANFDTLPPEQQEALQAEQSRAEREGKISGDLWKKARAATRRQFCEELNYAIEECIAGLKELNRVNDELYDRNQVPSTPQLAKSLDEIHSQVKKILADKRIEEPDPADQEAYANGEAADDGAPRTAGTGGGRGAIDSRADALRRLGEIATFFQRTEPHSPVSYIVQRAVKWGNMPLDSWLQEVVKDENVLGNIRETLGLGSYSSESFGSSESFDEYSSSEESASSSSSDDW
jgi:type VI secretion system protein ImpA